MKEYVKSERIEKKSEEKRRWSLAFCIHDFELYGWQRFMD